MEKYIYRIVLLFSLIVYGANAYTYDFLVDGIYYNKISNNEVEVTFKSTSDRGYSGEITIPNSIQYGGKTYSVTSIGENAFEGCSGITGLLTIPNTIVTIGNYAFSECSGLTGSLTIPSSVTSIGYSSFYRCSGFTGLLTIPNSIITIGGHAFSGCKGLTGSLTIPNSLKIIEAWVFEGCSGLTGLLTIPNSVTSIEEHAFYGCRGFTGLTIPNSIISIKEHAFSGCVGLIGSLEIPSSVSSIGTSAFQGCIGIETAIVKTGNTYYDSRDNCNAIIKTNSNELVAGFKNTTIPNTVTSIGQSAFMECSSLKSLTIPNSVSSICQSAFLNCKNLTSITIPNSITFIGNYAFGGCAKLNKVISEITSPFSIDNTVFYSSSLHNVLQVPKGTKAKYEQLSGWSKYFKSIEETEEGVSTLTLSIKATGNGSVSYNGNTIRSKTSTFTVNGGTSATITFAPDNGYRIKSVKVNNSDVTSNISNNQYTISSINKNTTVEVEFEAIPATTYTLSIKATGNGSASYNSTTIRSKTSTFTVNEGTSATITFAPDNGYRIKSVKVNSSDVTSNISNNQYTISNINKNTTVEVEFEAIPATTYTLSIKATGNGSASYNGTTIRSKTSTFTVNEGTSATITFTPDNGYRIKSVKENNIDVTSYVSNNAYVVNVISRDTNIEVEFEPIPATAYTLSINAYGNGYAYYNGETIRNSTRYYTVNEGAYVSINLIPDNGYRIKSIKENSVDVTSSVWSSQYIIYSLNSNTTIEVEFEAIPVTTYSLSIKAIGNGSASYNGTTIRSKTSTFTVNEGTAVTILFIPDNGYRIKSVMLNNSDVTSSVSNNQYTINNVRQNTTLEVEFAEELKTFADNGVNYSVMSYNDRTVYVSNGSYGSVLEVPSKINYQDIEWTVAGIDNGALTNNPDLAAIIWNPTANFTVSVSNPNLLLYVKSASYAPAAIINVIVNNVAEIITLTDAASGNNFYCPQEFTAKSISYTHNYGMITGIGESRGWETIALPFDVQKITHSSKGEIVPFANWKSGDSKKPFWLMELGTSGFVDASAIKANTPYIISMPNHTNYKNEFRLNGNITFSAQNVKVKASNNLQSTSSGDKTFHPNYAVLENTNAYALNVNNDYVSYTGGSKEGSTFVLNLRKVHPFEAYMTSTSKARQTIAIQDNLTTGIREVAEIWDDKIIRVYNLSGQLLMVEENKSLNEIKQLLSTGVYIVNGKKLIVR